MVHHVIVKEYSLHCTEQYMTLLEGISTSYYTTCTCNINSLFAVMSTLFQETVVVLERCSGCWVRGSTALVQNPGSAPSTQTRELTISFCGSDTVFWAL